MSELKTLYPDDISETFDYFSDPAAARARNEERRAANERLDVTLRRYSPGGGSVVDLPTLAPQHPPSDRRIQHNNALRTTVIMGDLLAQRLRLKVADNVDFESEGLIAAWQNAVARLRSFGK